jgi:WD40 repeat protein/serine/threonine protein kinase
MIESHGDQRQIHAAPPDVDAVCDAFEEAWLAGHKPRIEDFLARGDSVHRDALLRELLLAEWDLRRRHGQHTDYEAYQGRFPERGHAVTDLWRVWKEMPSQSMNGDGEFSVDPTRDGKPPEPGTIIVRYKLLEKLGEGGFGLVWVAEQREPVKRRVALKIVKLGMDTKQVIARFEAERQALAMMDHPNIAKVFDAGAIETGRPYFVMELVRGVPITQYCDENNLSTIDRLELFIAVCKAIQHAHQKGIIHRDVKPSNILVTLHDGVPVPKVIDFGIAKAIHSDLTDKTIYTQFQQFIGTPAYISPEQAEMSGLDIDTRSDIYSLGVLLYELLTGKTPFDAKELLAVGLDEMRRTIREKEPLRPSTRLSGFTPEELTTTARRRRGDPPKLINSLRGDLDCVVMKCLEKDRTRRYETASGLAEDLHRHLNNEPVLARPPSVSYRLQKSWRRNKVVYTAVAAVAVALVCGIALSSWLAVQARRAKDDALAARNAESEKAIEAQTARQRADGERKRAEGSADELIRHLYVADIKVAFQALQEENLGLARQLIYKYLPLLGVATSDVASHSSGEERAGGLKTTGITRDVLGWEWRYLWQLCQGEESFTVGRGKYVRCLAFSPDGRLLAMGRDRRVEILEAESRRVIARLDGFNGYISNGGLAFSPQGRYLAAKGGTMIRIWQVGKWESPLQQFEGPPTHSYTYNTAVVFSADDATFATRVPGGVRFWDTKTWQESRFEEGPEFFGAVLYYSRDGKWLAISNWNAVEVRDAKTHERIAIFRHESEQHEVHELRVMSIDGSATIMAAGNRNGQVTLWETKNWREVGRFEAHPSYVLGLALSPDGRTLATGGVDQLIKIWDVERLMGDLVRGAVPSPIRKLRGHEATIYGLTFSPDGQSLTSTSKDGTAKIWKSIEVSGPASLPNSKDALWFAHDGARLITLNHDGRLHFWDTRSRSDLGPVGPQLDGDRFGPRTVSDDGKWLALGFEDGAIELWNLQTNQREKSWKEDNLKIAHLAFSRHGRLLAAGGDRRALHEHGRVRVWDTTNGRRRLDFTDFFGPLAFSPDDRRLASTRLDGSVVIWDLRTGVSVAELPEDITFGGSMAFSPVDDRLAAGGEEPIVRLWNIASGENVDSLLGSRMCIANVAFTADGRTVAARTVDKAIKLFNVPTGKELLNIGHFMECSSFLLSPNGEYLALTAAGSSGEQGVQLWRAPTFEEIAAAEASRQKKIEAD